MADMYLREDSRRRTTTPDEVLTSNWEKTFGSADSKIMREAEEKEKSESMRTPGQYPYLKCISCGDEKSYSPDLKFEICSKCGTGTFRTKYGWR